MNLKNYLQSSPRGEATRLAAELNVSLSYLSQMASGTAPMSPARCVEIEQKTNGAVPRQDSKPNDWKDIWPELVADPA